MDAVTRHWRILLALVFESAAPVFMLSLFFLVAIFLMAVLEADKRSSVILMMSTVPACGFVAMSTKKVVLYAATGASLGLPRQAELLRSGQVLTIVLFVVLPACLALLYGASPGWAALLLFPAALGVLFELKGGWVVGTVLALALGTRAFAKSFDSVFDVLANPVFRPAVTLASAAVLYWWLGLAKKIEKRAAGASQSLADAKHESSTASPGEPVGLTPAQVEAMEQVYDREVATATAGIEAGSASRALSLGIAFDGRLYWRGVAQLVGIGWIASALVHIVFRRSIQDTALLVIIFFAVSALLSRVTALRVAWQSHPTEEALLKLAPLWPDTKKLKAVFLQLIVSCQVGVWLTGILILIPFVAIRWLGVLQVAASMLVLFAASCGASGALLLTLSRKNVKPLSIATIVLFISEVCGIAACYFGVVADPNAFFLGVGFILLPLLVGMLSFWFRPLQFPAQVIVKQ